MSPFDFPLPLRLFFHFVWAVTSNSHSQFLFWNNLLIWSDAISYLNRCCLFALNTTDLLTVGIAFKMLFEVFLLHLEWEWEFQLARRNSNSQSRTLVVLNWEKKLGVGVGSHRAHTPYLLQFTVQLHKKQLCIVFKFVLLSQTMDGHNSIKKRRVFTVALISKTVPEQHHRPHHMSAAIVTGGITSSQSAAPPAQAGVSRWK